MKHKLRHQLFSGDLFIAGLLFLLVLGVTNRLFGSPMQEPNTPERMDATPGTTNPPANPAPVTVAVTTDKTTYNRGDRISFTLIARNNSDTPQVLQFNSGQFFEITARSQPKDQEQTPIVWSWSHNKMFTKDMPQVNIAPGATKTWTATWDQTDDNGHELLRGDYLIESRIVAQPRLIAPTLTLSLEN